MTQQRLIQPSITILESPSTHHTKDAYARPPISELSHASCDEPSFSLHQVDTHLYIISDTGLVTRFTLDFTAMDVLSSPETLRLFDDPTTVVTASALSPTSPRLAVVEQYGQCAVVHTDEFRVIKRYSDTEGVCPNAAVYATADTLAVSGAGGLVKLYGGNDLTIPRVAHTAGFDAVQCMTASHMAANIIALGTGNGAVTVIDVAASPDLVETRPLESPEARTVTQAVMPPQASSPISALSTDPRTAATVLFGTLAGMVGAVNAKTGSVVELHDVMAPVNTIAVSGEGMMVVGTEDGCIYRGFE